MPVLLYEVGAGGARTAVLEVDVVLRASPTYEVQATDNPVEEGADVTDHVIPRPATVEVEAGLSDRRMDGTVQPGRCRAAWETLQSLAERAARLVVVLPQLGEREDVLLLRFTSNLTSEAYEALRFTASFRTVRLVSSQVVPAPKRVETKAKPKAQLGQKGATAASAGTQQKSRTLLKRYLVDGLLRGGE